MGPITPPSLRPHPTRAAVTLEPLLCPPVLAAVHPSSSCHLGDCDVLLALFDYSLHSNPSGFKPLKAPGLGWKGAERVPRWKKQPFTSQGYIPPRRLYVPYLHLLIAFCSYFPDRQEVYWEGTKLPGPSLLLPERCAVLGEGAACCTCQSNEQQGCTFP